MAPPIPRHRRPSAGPRLGAWPTLSPAAHLADARATLPFPLEDPGCRLHARARHALWHALPALGLREGDEVLVPAYHHGSEVEAIVRLGLEPRFYRSREDLAPDLDHVEGLRGPRARALVLTHYLGFPQDAAALAAWCHERGLALIEDGAMAWLAERDGAPVGSHGDAAFFCLYKSVAVPDGAALVVPSGRLDGPMPPPAAAGGLARARRIAGMHRQWLAQRSALAALTAPSADGDYDPAADFALGAPGRGVEATTMSLLPRLADVAVAARRRAIYRALLEDLADLVPPPFDDLPAGAAPFVFPIGCDDKDGVLARLRARGIDPLDLWSAPHPTLDEDAFPEAAARRRATVGLPVHQGLTPDDVERIAAVARGGSRRRRPAWRPERVRDLDALRDEWEPLALATCNIFSTWEWASAWQRHLAGGAELHVTACRGGDGRLAAVLPLAVSRSGNVRIARFAGHGPADQLGPVCAPRDVAGALRALRRIAAGPDGWDVSVADHLPVGEGWGALLGGHTLQRESSPVIRVDSGGWDAYLTSRSASFRRRVRYKARRLARDHAVGYRLADDPTRLDEDLDALVDLHRARWGRDDVDAFAGPLEAFHRDFAHQALRRGWLRLWFLEVDGRPVAAWHGFRYAGVESFYQSGRDPRLEEASVGAVLMAHTIRAALEDGVREYRLLRGAETYKDGLATADAEVETIAAASSARGRAWAGVRGARRLGARGRGALAAARAKSIDADGRGGRRGAFPWHAG